MNYKDLKKDELLKIARERGLEVKTSNTKQEIIDALIEYDKKLTSETEKPEKASKKKKRKKKARKPTNKLTNKQQNLTRQKAKLDNLKKETGFLGDTTPGTLNLQERVYRNAPDVWMINPEETYAGEDSRIGIELMQTLSDPNQHVTGTVKMVDPSTDIKINGETRRTIMFHVECKSNDDGSRQMVYVPSFYFFNEDYDLDEDNLYKYAALRLDSECDLNLLHKSEDGKFYLCGRLLAMKKQRCNVWYAKDGKGNYLFQPGKKVQARVVAASKRFIQVEVAGAEAFITDKDLSWNYISDCRDICNVGDKIIILLKEIKREAEPMRMDERAKFAFPVKFKASVKEVAVNPKELYFDEYHLKSQLEARVVNIKEGKNKNIIFVNDGRYDIYCQMRPGVGLLPHVGDKVIIKITGTDEQTRNVWGEIIHVYKKRQNGVALSIRK